MKPQGNRKGKGKGKGDDMPVAMQMTRCMYTHMDTSIILRPVQSVSQSVRSVN